MNDECPNCGAPVRSPTCKYCKTVLWHEALRIYGTVGDVTFIGPPGSTIPFRGFPPRFVFNADPSA